MSAGECNCAGHLVGSFAHEGHCPANRPAQSAGERRTFPRHWIGDAPTSVHGNGAASFDLTTRDPAEVTCRLCLSLLARGDHLPADPQGGAE